MARPRVIRDVHDYITGHVFALVACAACGYARTTPVPASLDQYYPTKYRRFGSFAAFVLRRLYLRRVDGWLARLPPTGVALEIGSGTGWMLGALRSRGWRAVGSERSIEAAAIARDASGAPVFVGDMGAIRREPLLDLVIMFHVLEHLADPVAALRAAALRLRPGGTLVLGIPNVGSWQARFAGRRWMHLDAPRHLVHFTPDAIERALASSGFRVAHVSFTSLEHDPLGWVQAALERLGFEEGIVLKILFRMPRKTGLAGVALAALLSIPLGLIGAGLAVASWRAGAGALMQVWAVREP
jgi:SAM-dependent methyltransferase